jgi:hypothetical protein
MHTHHRSNLPIPFANLLDEALVFLDTAARDIPVGDFIA